MVGTTLGEHYIDSALGEGFSGCVYKVLHNPTQNNLALKVSKHPSTIEELNRFNQENEILYKLQPHENIIKPMSKIISISPEKSYYTMELADGNLNNYLTDQYSLAFSEKMRMFKDICVGLAYAHKKDIVHRDLHWENVLISLTPEITKIKLNDFGRAKDFTGSSLSSGKICWGNFVMPPEIRFNIYNNPDIESYIKADLYSLGIILYTFILNFPFGEIQGIINNITTYLKVNQNNLSMNINYYNWLKTRNEDSKYLSLNSLELTDEQLLNINFLLKKLSHIDYKERFDNVEDMLVEMNNLNL